MYSDTNVAHGEIRKVRHTLVLNIVTVDDVRCKEIQSVTSRRMVKEQMTKPGTLRTYEPLKILSHTIYIPCKNSVPKQNILYEVLYEVRVVESNVVSVSHQRPTKNVGFIV